MVFKKNNKNYAVNERQQSEGKPVHTNADSLNKTQPVIAYDATKDKKWHKPGFLNKKSVLLIVLVAAMAGVLIVNFFGPKTYTVGTHQFSQGEVDQLAVSLESAGESEGAKQAMKRLILLNALKTEADQLNITYTDSDIDEFLKDHYARYGGKNQYLAYMADEYKWTQSDVLNHQTAEYLKQKLEKELLSERSYTAVQMRWDNIRIFHQEQFDTIYAEKLAMFKSYFLPLFQSKVSNEELKGLVDISPDMPENDQNRIFMERQAMPVYLMNIPPEQQASANPSQLYGEGEDLYERLRSLQKPGDFIGPFKANTGMLVIARLDSSAGGKYGTWDHMVKEYAKAAKIPAPLFDTELESEKPQTEKTSWFNNVYQAVKQRVSTQEVHAAAPAPTCTVTASKYNISAGESVTVSWTFYNTRPNVNADRGSDLPGFDQGKVSGSQTVKPTTTTKYNFYAKNADHGVRICGSVTITVDATYNFAQNCLTQSASRATWTISYKDYNTGANIPTNHSIGVTMVRGSGWCTKSGYTGAGWSVQDIVPPIDPGPYQQDFRASKSFPAFGGQVVVEADCMGPIGFSNVNPSIPGYTLHTGYNPPTGSGTNGIGNVGTVYYVKNTTPPPEDPPPSSNLSCTPPYLRVLVGQPATFTASGGSGADPYSWTIDGLFVGSGSVFSMAFPAGGTKTVTLHKGAATTNCYIEIYELTNQPYLSIEGGDVLSGAAFGNACEATDEAKAAAIKTNGFYDRDNPAVMSSGFAASQYAVFASGAIGEHGLSKRNAFLGNYGYRRTGMENVKDLLFANRIASHEEYGNFYPGGSGLPCVDLDAEYAGSDITNNPSGFIASETGTKKMSGSISVGNISVAAGTKKTLVVDGDVTITGPIIYANSGSYDSVGNIPYLRIIARNIFIERDVRIIDGHYVAYPRADNSGGIIDTCSNMPWQYASGLLPTPRQGEWPAGGRMTTASCSTGDPGNSFVVNGSLTARRILWKRTDGTIGTAGNVADPGRCLYVNHLANGHAFCAAEAVDFNPEAYLARFGNGTANVNPVPVSSVEVPPVY